MSDDPPKEPKPPKAKRTSAEEVDYWNKIANRAVAARDAVLAKEKEHDRRRISMIGEAALAEAIAEGDDPVGPFRALVAKVDAKIARDQQAREQATEKRMAARKTAQNGKSADAEKGGDATV